MATLQNIRDRAGLLVAIVIGLALVGFIFTDMGGSNAGRGSRAVAKINGNSIDAEEYMSREKNLREFYQLNAGGQNLDAQLEKQISQETWRRMVREIIMESSYSDLGIYVSDDELKTMITGDQSMGAANTALSDPHPIIRQMFANPETGQLNRAVMTNYFNMLDNPQFAQEKTRWLFIENEIVDEKMNEKYFNLVRKGFQPSSLDLRDQLEESNKSADFTYLARNFNTLSDEEISFSEADLKSYFREHQEKYRQNASRTFQYVVFEVVPSDKDIERAEYWSKQTKVEFGRQSAEQVSSYVNGSSDDSFDPTYYTYDELPAIIRDSVYNASAETVFGPYRQDDAFVLSRASDVQMRPDSVRARHILLSPQAFQGNRQLMESISDSLVQVLENGGSFNQIALQFSADESNRSIGGDLGWFREGMMVSEFNNACFENKTGDLLTVDTQFGKHIIRIEDQSAAVRKVQVASIVRTIFASDETNQDYYNRAVKFRGKATDLDKFTEQAREFGLDPRFAPNVARDQVSIPGIEEPRSMIKWAYTSEVSSVSSIFSQPDDKYIVAVLTEAHEDGYANLEKVRTEVTLAVKKQKKAEMIAAELESSLSGVSDLNQFGSSNNEQVGDASQVKFSNTYVAGIGLEPYIVGASMYLPLDQVSAPMIGESGVFVIKVNSRNAEESTEADLEAMRSRLKYSLESRSNFEAYNALVEAADLEDNRLEVFYN